MTQPVEGQERMCPIRTDRFEIVTDSAGPGEFRGGVGLDKEGTILEVEGCVSSYFCDRERSVVWGIEGGLPSRPHGLWMEYEGKRDFLGAVFSDVPVAPGTRFWRGTAGGGGYGEQDYGGRHGGALAEGDSLAIPAAAGGPNDLDDEIPF